LVGASKKTGFEVTADKTKYIIVSRDKNVRRIHNIKNDKSTFERAEAFKYLGTNETDKSSIQ
jgi:hypothetical protein